MSPFFLADLLPLLVRVPREDGWATMAGGVATGWASLSMELGDSTDTDGEGEWSGPGLRDDCRSCWSQVLLKEASVPYEAGGPAMWNCCTVAGALYEA